MKRLLMPAVVAGLLTGAVQAAAQTPAPAPPPPRETFPVITLFGDGNPDALGPGHPPPLRQAVASGDIREWLPVDDPSVAAAKASARVTGSTRLDLSVTPEGTVSGCRAVNTVGPPALFDGLCDRVSERAAFKPAIDESGVPLPDVYSLWINFGRGWSPPTRLIDVRGLPPAPPPAGGQWPPVSDPRLVTVSGLDVLPGGPMDPASLGAPWAGVVYAPENTAAPCRIVKSSGDAVFNAGVCKAAAKGRYDLSAAGSPSARRMQLHFVQADGKTWALVPIQRGVTKAVPTARAHQTIAQTLATLPDGGAARVRLNVTIDPTGAIVGCTIRATSGTDAGDVAICTAVRRSGPFVPAKDIFGRPFQSRLNDWSPATPLPKPGA